MRCRVKQCAAIAALALFVSTANVLSAQRYVQGEVTTYKLDYWNRTRSDMRALFGMGTTVASPSPLSHDIQSEVHGMLEQHVFRRDTIFHIALILREPLVKVTMNGTSADASARSIAASLARLIIVRASSQGKVLSVQIDPLFGETSSSFARTII